MSVLAQVLDDLAARGAAPRSVDATALPLAPPMAPMPNADTRRLAPTRRQGLWLATLTILACTTAALAWLEVRAKSQPVIPRPLGLHDLDSIVMAAATPAFVSTVISTAPDAQKAAPVERSAMQAASNTARPQHAAAASAHRSVAVVDAGGARRVATSAMTSSMPSSTAAGTTASAMPPATNTAAVATKSAAIAATSAAPTTASAAPSSAAAGAIAAPAAMTTNADAVVRRSSASMTDPQADLARAADLISRGRAREAKPLLLDLLVRDPRHAAARKALVALQSEGGERTQALVTLLDGVSVDPTRFATPAAQLQTELGDARGALNTLQRMPPEKRDGAFYALNGGIALAAESPQQAVEAYQRAVSLANAQPVWLLGLALAHEGAGQPAEAQAAYARALQQPQLPADARTFAQQKLGAVSTPAPVRPSSRRD